VPDLSTAEQIREFLTSRRARLSPDRAGLPAYGTRRRVQGLRREEVALLANISVEYYTRLERGHVRGVSEEIIDGIARALQLGPDERAHLVDLVGVANETILAPPTPIQMKFRPAIGEIVESMAGMPAMVRNRRLDVLYANRAGEAFYEPIFRDPVRPANPARFTFLDPASKEFYLDWEAAADDMVALLRAESGRNPDDPLLLEFIEELSARSESFRTRWAIHDVLFHRSGFRRFRHPVVGEVTLTYEDLDVASDPGLTILVFTAEPGSPARASLDRLMSSIKADEVVPATENR